MDINLHTVLESKREENFFDSYPDFAGKLNSFRESFKSEAINNSFDEEANAGLCTFQVFFFDEKAVLNSAFICSAQYQKIGSELSFTDFIADELSEEVYYELKNNLKK